MKKFRQSHTYQSLLFVFLIFLASSVSIAQVNEQQAGLPETQSQENPDKEKKEKTKKKKNEFKVFGGLNFNQLSVTENIYQSELNMGYLFGASYKQGKFFYWELGARYNNRAFDLTNLSDTNFVMTNSTFSTSNIDVPISFGINFLSVISRLVGLRVFISAVPSFTLNVSDNDLGMTKDNMNSFVFYGQGGIGVDVAFIFLEAGYNYGFSDVIKNDVKSNPSQVFVNLGFRF